MNHIMQNRRNSNEAFFSDMFN